MIGKLERIIFWRPVVGYEGTYEVSHCGRVRRVSTGRVLRGFNRNGYLTVNLSKGGKHKSRYIHRLVANAWIPNPQDKACVDHIDHDKTNNHASNIRWSTVAENLMNQQPREGASKFKGVTWDKANDKWMAYIKKDYKHRHLGYFTNEADAAEAYDQAARELFGDFAFYNFPLLSNLSV